VICEGRDDAVEFANIRSAMKVLMYTDEEIQYLYCVLAAVLHLGNIEFRGICTVSQKSIPDIFDCNLKTICQILIIFGTNIRDTTCHQMTV